MIFDLCRHQEAFAINLVWLLLIDEQSLPLWLILW